jgi:hypothetical protein
VGKKNPATSFIFRDETNLEKYKIKTLGEMARFKTKKVVEEVTKLELDEIRFCVGLDLSFNSPGCAIYDRVTNRWYIAAFAQKAREDIGFYFATQNAEVWLLDVLPETSSDVVTYVHIEKHLMHFILTHIPAECREHHTEIQVEAYAFAAPSESGWNYKLHESTGIILRALYVERFLHVSRVVSGAWKRTVLANGKATKLDVVHFVATNARGPRINMLQILGYDETTLSLNDKNEYVIPTPTQDLADACAICMFIFTKRKVKVKQLLEIQTQVRTPAAKIKGFMLPLRKIDVTKKRKKIKPAPQPAFLQPDDRSKVSFWATTSKKTVSCDGL